MGYRYRFKGVMRVFVFVSFLIAGDIALFWDPKGDIFIIEISYVTNMLCIFLSICVFYSA